jgi:hypothetical protein
MDSYTERELRDAAKAVPSAKVHSNGESDPEAAIQDILKVMHTGNRTARYTEEEFLQASNSSGWSISGPKIWKQAKVNAEGTAKKPVIVNLQDECTYEELKGALAAKYGYGGVVLERELEWFAQYIHDHREVLLDKRVYKSADNLYYRWSETNGSFWRFGSGSLVRRDTPKRPLELLP